MSESLVVRVHHIDKSDVTSNVTANREISTPLLLARKNSIVFVHCGYGIWRTSSNDGSLKQSYLMDLIWSNKLLKSS